MVNEINKYELYGGLVIAIILIVIAITYGIIKKKLALPYKKANSLLTNAEKVFFRVLLDIDLGNDIYIFSKVRVADIIFLPGDIKDRNKYLSKILSKHIDFLICSRDTFAPLLAIELDDKSHNLPQNHKRDIEKNKILSSAKIPMMRVQNRRDYDSNQLKKEILRHIR